MIKCLIQVSLFCLVSFQLSADTISLSTGDSVRVGSTTVTCNVEEQSCSSPNTSQDCAYYNSQGRCVVYDYTDVIPRGAECERDCANIRNDRCTVRNECEFLPSDCGFKRRYCDQIDRNGRCTSWSTEYIY